MEWYWIVAIVVAAFAAVAAVTGYVVFRMGIIPKRVKKPETLPYKIKRAEIRKANNAYLYSLNPEDISRVTDDGLTLRAWYVPAEKPCKRFVICVHGYNCNGPDEFSHMLKFYHNTLGYHYFLPDLRGHGRSDGNRIGFGALDSDDILDWIRYLVERFGDEIEIILHGISMGAATVMLANAKNPPPQVKLVIEDCGFTSAYEEMANTVRDKAKMNLSFLVALANPWCRFLGGYDLKKDAAPLRHMKDAKCPVLFVHGGADTFVPTSMVYLLYEACPTPKDLLIVEGAVHAYSYYDGKEAYEQKVTDFIESHMKITVHT